MSKRSIILEGPNGGGKSTLSKILEEHFGLPAYHSGPNPGDTDKAIMACNHQMLKIMNGFIVDRVTPISRPVYDHDTIPAHEIESFGLVLDNMLRHAVVVYCNGVGPFTNKPYYPDGHFETVSKERIKIRKLYEVSFKDIPHIPYDWHKDSLKELLKELDKCIIT